MCVFSDWAVTRYPLPTERAAPRHELLVVTLVTRSVLLYPRGFALCRLKLYLPGTRKPPKNSLIIPRVCVSIGDENMMLNLFQKFFLFAAPAPVCFCAVVVCFVFALLF